MTGRGGRYAWLVLPVTALAVAVVGAIAIYADLAVDERHALAVLATPPRIGLAVLFVTALVGLVGYLAYRAVAASRAAASRMAEGVRLIAHGNPAHRLAAPSVAELAAVADAVNDLAQARSGLLAKSEVAAAAARARVDAERRRLAALISELDQAVVVCNLDGRILLYNAAAQALLGGMREGGEALGLGRSVFAVIDRALIRHAQEAMEDQGARGERESAHFITATPEGRLLRVHVAPVPGGDGAEAVRELAGYVLLLSDVTEAVDADVRRGALFQRLVETARAGLANIRAAIENLTEHPDMDAARRARFAAIIRDEAVNLSERVHRNALEAAEGQKARWPLEDMRGEDLLTLARRRIERRTGLKTRIEMVDPALWLSVDSYSVAQCLSYVALRLKDDYAIQEIRFRLVPVAGHAQLDLAWRGPPMSAETAFAWQSDPFTLGGEESTLTLEQVVERHDGEAWYSRDVPTQVAYFRLLLPLAATRAGALPRSALKSRPEFYDFDLFRRSPVTDALYERPLAGLAYTVFDTETTGLNPTEGDEIIAIGAVRIVNGRLITGETFASLVDPQRSVSASSMAIHGITPAALAGAPSIEEVLPRFHRFAEETVLVGHNAAFDMRFLELKEAQSGVRFTQPVLDTLLLSAVAHPASESHGLEDIAARLGIDVVGRHTAMGDAQVTAEAFLRLIPILAERGIRTLGEARAASERTYYARLKY